MIILKRTKYNIKKIKIKNALKRKRKEKRKYLESDFVRRNSGGEYMGVSSSWM